MLFGVGAVYENNPAELQPNPRLMLSCVFPNVSIELMRSLSQVIMDNPVAATVDDVAGQLLHRCFDSKAPRLMAWRSQRWVCNQAVAPE